MNCKYSQSFVVVDRSTANYVLSAQKLVKGENIMDFTCNYIFSKKSLEGVMKLEHKFLWKQQRHISDFRRSEAAVPWYFFLFYFLIEIHSFKIRKIIHILCAISFPGKPIPSLDVIV